MTGLRLFLRQENHKQRQGRYFSCRSYKKEVPLRETQTEKRSAGHKTACQLWQMLYAAFLAVTVLCGYTQPVFAATIWTKANEIMKDVYNQIILISTIAAVVTASVALLMMNFSKSGKTVDESRAWLKRIVITWAILNGLGFIMAYITPFFAGGKWNG